jgi:hypothetical protein
MAIALLTYHVERRIREARATLLDGERFAFSVTPAIAIVLFVMCGLSVSFIPGGRAE